MKTKRIPPPVPKLTPVELSRLRIRSIDFATLHIVNLERILDNALERYLDASLVLNEDNWDEGRKLAALEEHCDEAEKRYSNARLKCEFEVRDAGRDDIERARKRKRRGTNR